MFNPSEVRQIAAVEGYVEVEVAVGDRGRLLSFRHGAKKGCGETNCEVGPVKISVFFTTGSVSTSLEHPKAGKGQLFRTVDGQTMLKNIFDNPRLHSNVGYKKTKETIAEHKQSTVSVNAIINIAIGNNCKQLPVKPQERDSLLIFQHSVGRIRVWFKRGTMEFQIGKQMHYKKNLNLVQMREYFENPRKVLEDDDTSSSVGSLFTYRPATCIKTETTTFVKQETTSNIHQPLQSRENCMHEIQIKTEVGPPVAASKENEVINLTKPLKSESRVRIEAMANQKGFYKIHDQPTMLGFKDSEGETTINVYTTKGTVTVQPGHGSTKNCSVAVFQSILQQHSRTSINVQYQPLFSSGYLAHVNKEMKNESLISSRSQVLSEAMEKARAAAAALFSNI